MLEIGLLITICFLVILTLLINKKLNNFNKELNLLKNNLSSKNDFIKNPINENNTVNNKKNSSALDTNLIRSSQLTVIPIEKLTEIVKDENKICNTQVEVKSGQNISVVNMKVND